MISIIKGVGELHCRAPTCFVLILYLFFGNLLFHSTMKISLIVVEVVEYIKKIKPSFLFTVFNNFRKRNNYQQVYFTRYKSKIKIHSIMVIN